MAGFFDPTDPTAGGLMSGFAPAQGMPGMMGMFANPQTAGLLGMAGGLMQAAGASRLPVTNGAALGAGFQGMQQGAGNALQMQMQMAKMQSQLNPFGVGFGGLAQPQGAPQPAGPVGSPVIGSANTGPMSGPSAGMGLMAGSPPVNPNDVAQSSPNGLAMFGGHTPQEVMLAGARLAAFGNPAGAEMMKIAAQADPSLTPTDITKMGIQGGMSPADIQAANRAGVQKANYIAPTALRTPIYFDPTTGTTKVVDPAQLAAGYGAQYGAEARAQAGFKPMQVWDPNYVDPQTGQKGGFVFQTAANMSDAANGNAAQPQIPVGIRNNNFGNIKGANGQFASYDSPQDGVNAADQLLATYGSRHGINTITGIANRWAPAGDGSNNPTAKAAAIAAASGVPANQPINLQDPAMRARILPALFDTETPGWRNAIGGGQPAQSAPQRSGPMAAQPPVGYAPATNAAQTAASKQMADSYQGLAGTDANYQQSRNALTDMLALSNRQGALDKASSFLPYDWSTKVDSDAAQYAKAHSTFIAQQGSALGAGGTDQARGTIEESVPTYDKPQSARTAGLNMQLNNLDYRHLETQLMTPAFQGGDQKGYTTLNAQFHNAVKPEMMPTIMPIMQMSGPQQQAAVQAAVKANPAMRPAFEMMFNAGMLK